MTEISFSDPNVATVFEGFPDAERKALLRIRGLIFKVAQQTPKVGKLTESLRWGQPSYLTLESKSGSTIRLGVLKTGGFAIYAHCQTTIMSDFRIVAPELKFEGNRAVKFARNDLGPLDSLKILLKRALTYHL